VNRRLSKDWTHFETSDENKALRLPLIGGYFLLVFPLSAE